jgi:hypothetical protein
LSSEKARYSFIEPGKRKPGTREGCPYISGELYGVYKIYKIPGFAGVLWLFLFGICEHPGE